MSNALGAVPMMPMALANSACEDEKDGSASTAITITISLGEEVGERESNRQLEVTCQNIRHPVGEYGVHRGKQTWTDSLWNNT